MRTLKILLLAVFGHFAALSAQTTHQPPEKAEDTLKTPKNFPQDYLEWHCDTVPVYFVVSGENRTLEEIEGFRLDCYFDKPGEWLEGIEFNPQYRYFEFREKSQVWYMDWHVYLDRPRGAFNKKRN